ncbi:hypothetical protein ACN38_g5236 [Penicillium nordicum]|uniref:Major facilitator superfamily (MFS) profile domain-containing protein n=1 Tax=Penicillium nordicum TaxID=229535 RepID=A0A0M9WGE2_9EURO|nr:hypothetical protein ACN38_g5236 [Penicillium nordicum]
MAILAKFDGINKKPAVTENAPQETAEIQQSHQSLTIDFEEKRPRKPTKLARVKEMDHNTCCLFFHVFNATVFVNCRTRVCDELHMDALLEAVLVLLTFVLTYCIGPLMLGLLSEMFKRATILHSGNSFYLIFNLVLALEGAGGLVAGAGIISDCFPKEERGWVIAIYNLGPGFGPSLGAVVGGFIT